MTKNMNSDNYCHCNINDDRKDFDNGNNKIHNIVMITIFTLSITVPRVIPIPDLLWPKINIRNILR